MSLKSFLLNAFKKDTKNLEHQHHVKADDAALSEHDIKLTASKSAVKAGCPRPVDFRAPTFPPVSVSISSATFSDGTTLTLQPNDIVVFVGPNNSGKSAALRDIRQCAEKKDNFGLVIQQINLHTSGSSKDVFEWIHSVARPSHRYGVSMLNGTVELHRIENLWNDCHKDGLSSLTNFFLRSISTMDRLTAADPKRRVSIIREALEHPLHFIDANEELEFLLSHHFKRAFGTDLIAHRGAGSDILLVCGNRPEPAEQQDRISIDYLRKLDSFDRIHLQGDGVRSFVGVLLHTLIAPTSCVLIDEPDAFLHPPQARQMGRLIADGLPTESQLILSTHSADLVRGLLDSGNKRIRVVRIVRDGNRNRICELSNDSLHDLWNDPILKHSNVIEAVFHRRAIVCEGEGDCWFYAAMMAALEDHHDMSDVSETMFLSAGGKDGIPKIVAALSALSVPVAVIADFDILRSSAILDTLATHLAFDWQGVKSDLKLVVSAINDSKPELNTDEVRRQISETLQKVKSVGLPDQALNEITKILQLGSSWSKVKDTGVLFVPQGQASQTCQSLLGQFEAAGLFIVPVGQLERFCPSVSGHGTKWVTGALVKDLKQDPEFEDARRFCSRIISWCKTC